MSRARLLLYAHCLLAVPLAALAVFALRRRAANDLSFDRALVAFSASPAGPDLGWLCLLCLFAFPVALESSADGRMPGWRRWLVVGGDSLLGWVPFAGLLALAPARYGPARQGTMGRGTAPGASLTARSPGGPKTPRK
jgi:hypothetical protein